MDEFDRNVNLKIIKQIDPKIMLVWWRNSIVYYYRAIYVFIIEVVLLQKYIYPSSMNRI